MNSRTKTVTNPQNKSISLAKEFMSLPSGVTGDQLQYVFRSRPRYRRQVVTTPFDFLNEGKSFKDSLRGIWSSYHDHQHIFGRSPKMDAGEWQKYIVDNSSARAAILVLVSARVDCLRAEARDEQELFNEASAIALKTLCSEWKMSRRPAIFLLPNGNLRAIWENKTGEQIGIQFLQDGLAQFIIFRKSSKGLLRTMGVEAPNVLQQIVTLLGLGRLLNGER